MSIKKVFIISLIVKISTYFYLNSIDQIGQSDQGTIGQYRVLAKFQDYRKMRKI